MFEEMSANLGWQKNSLTSFARFLGEHGVFALFDPLPPALVARKESRSGLTLDWDSHGLTLANVAPRDQMLRRHIGPPLAEAHWTVLTVELPMFANFWTLPLYGRPGREICV